MRPTTLRAYQIRFGTLCILAYVVLSWAVRFDMRLGGQIASLVYPLDTFSMYAGMPLHDRSHLLVRDRRGGVHRITAFRSFDCGDPIAGGNPPCADRLGIPYMVENAMRYIHTHPGTGEMDVEIIARTWELHPLEAPVQVADCVVVQCKVSR